MVGKGGDKQKGRLNISEQLKEECRQEVLNENYRGLVRSLYVESLDSLVMSAVDGKIFVWGHEQGTIDMIVHMQKMMNGADSGKEDAATGRVVGTSCLHVLNGHSSAVSGLALVDKKTDLYLVSASWDCYVCVWDLATMSLVSRVKHTVSTAGQLSGDTIIMDLDYADKCEMVAYSTSDSSIFLCPFSKKRTGLRVQATLKGHSGEVTQIKWNPFIGKWVSGSEDGTIRIWPADGGSGCCDIVVIAGGPVTVITIDSTHGMILAAVGNVIKLYDRQLEVVQVSRGHTDSIQSIAHVPELNLYFSAGWDNTMRIWKAYHPRHSSTDNLSPLKQ